MRKRTLLLSLIAAILLVGFLVPTSRQAIRDAAALTEIAVVRALASDEKRAASSSPKISASAENPYADMRASGAAQDVLAVARAQIGVKYVLGARPRQRWALKLLGRGAHPAELDCSTFVAHAFLHGAGIWPGGGIAHTDEIWTQGGTLTLNTSPEETSTVIRGTMDEPPEGGLRPGDLLFARWGAGGYWGHVMIVSEGGLVIEAYSPDVHETRKIGELLEDEGGSDGSGLGKDGRKIGWMRIKALGA